MLGFSADAAHEATSAEDPSFFIAILSKIVINGKVDIDVRREQGLKK